MFSVETQGHELAKLNADILSMMKLQGGPGMHENRVWGSTIVHFLGKWGWGWVHTSKALAGGFSISQYLTGPGYS